MSGCRIPLTGRGGVLRGHCVVDESDYEALARFRWHLSSGYVTRSENGGGRTGCCFPMHRTIMGLARSDRRQVDHVNRNKLDNRRGNLRIVTHAQNMQNVGANATSTSMHRGVSWDSESRKWRAVGFVNGRIYHLGRFTDELEAARVVSDWRAEHMPFSIDALRREAA